MENNQSFQQFSDQIRLQNNLANLSLNDSIWSNSYGSKRSEERRNFDVRVGAELNSLNPSKPNNSNPKGSSDFNGFNNGWKFDYSGIGSGSIGGGSSQSSDMGGINGGFNKGVYSKPSANFNVNNYNYNYNNNTNFNGVGVNTKGSRNANDDYYGGKSGKKSTKINNNNNNSDNNNNSTRNVVDKRFKTLPPSESLPRNETIGGYIFVCNNDTMPENLQRELFGLPPRYRDSVRAITPGLPIFLYNYSTHQLHGIFEAASFGGSNIDPSAWEDKKNAGESRFPAQVRVVTRKICKPLEEDSFRPVLFHYDGPKFRLELNIPEALSLLDIFDEKPLKNTVQQ